MYLHREGEDGVVEGKGIVTIRTILRSTRNKGIGSIDTYLENNFTTVS